MTEWMNLLRAGVPAKLLSVVCLIGLCRALNSQPTRITTEREPSATIEIPPGKSAMPADMKYFGTWVEAARTTFTKVRDYQCTLVKRERVQGELTAEQTASMSVRSKPFSVYIKFLSPRLMAGKEASFVDGRNNGKMRAKNGGALQLVGYVSIDPTDKRALQGTRHSITEAGIGNLIEQLHANLKRSDGKPDAQVNVVECLAARRPSVRFELLDANADDTKTFSRTLVYFDQETNLPFRFEAYNRRGELLESFAYVGVRFNVGLTDSAFP